MNSDISKKTVCVAMSGGVDSSVAALWAKQQGYRVVGVHMKTWSPPGQPCTNKEDRIDAMKVCAQLNIPFITWDFTREYKKRVVDYMVGEYRAARTPNPDVMCNSEIKFGLFFNKAIHERNADFVATGHYVRRLESGIRNQELGLKLLRGKDVAKDQSYFLWQIRKEHLAKTLFPIGEFADKTEVREMAKKFNLETATKKDSQGVCFIGPIIMRNFLKNYINESPGSIVSVTGRKIGEHIGLPFYTIGQRRGIGVGGTGPYYVSEKKVKTNTLVVSPPARETELFSNSLIAGEVNFISHTPKLPCQADVQIRYLQKPVKATMTVFSGAKLEIEFAEPIRAVTEGQSVVFYKGDEVLGGGVITKRK